MTAPDFTADPRVQRIIDILAENIAKRADRQHAGTFPAEWADDRAEEIAAERAGDYLSEREADDLAEWRAARDFG